MSKAQFIFFNVPLSEDEGSFAFFSFFSSNFLLCWFEAVCLWCKYMLSSTNHQVNLKYFSLWLRRKKLQANAVLSYHQSAKEMKIFHFESVVRGIFHVAIK